MIELVTMVLSKIGDALIGAIIDNVSEEVRVKLQGDPAKKAIEHALASALDTIPKAV